MSDLTATISVPLTNATGLHARPSVKLTRLAKTFVSDIDVATDLDGPWVDAKSIVKLMAVRAGQGTILHFRADGADAATALVALGDLVAQNFHEEDAEYAGPTDGKPND